MTIELGFTDELCDTQYAPLAMLMAYYQQIRSLQPLATIQIEMKKRDFSAQEKLNQVLVSILKGSSVVKKCDWAAIDSSTCYS